MDSDRVSITVKDDDLWEQRMTRLRALEPVNQPQLPAEFNSRVYLQLCTTAKDGHVDKFIEALEMHSAEEGVSLSGLVRMVGPSGNSLFHVTAGVENADILRQLLEFFRRTSFVFDKNYQGENPLHVAARAGRIRTVELLLNHGMPSVPKKKGKKNHGMPEHYFNNLGNTALHEAVKNGDFDLTNLLLSRCSGLLYEKNKEGKCPLYSAVETGDLEIFKLLLGAVDRNEDLSSRIKGMSPVHGAVSHRRIDMLKEMSKRTKELFCLRDAGGGTPLHLAAHLDYVEGVEFLVDEFPRSAFEPDEEGYFPIHVACKMGHLETVKELLRHWPNPEELLNFYEGQNILHVAAKYGRASVVKYILGNPELEKLINAKDEEGNTPLHVATLHWQPEVLLSLTRDKRVDLKLVNNSNSTACDIVEEQLKEIDAPLRKSLTRTILASARAPRSKDKAIRWPKGPGRDMKPPDLDRLKDEANTRMVVATLVATMTFAAGFSVPGGYNDSEPDAGIAILLNKPMYDVFVICNTIAMYSSIIAVVILLWTQIKDSWAVLHALRKARLPLLIALATMSVAFMAGVYVTISKRTWIAVVALIIGIVALFIILSLYIALFVPLRYNCRVVQLFADYIIVAGIVISTGLAEGRATRPAHKKISEDEQEQYDELVVMAPSLATNIDEQQYEGLSAMAPLSTTNIDEQKQHEELLMMAPSSTKDINMNPRIRPKSSKLVRHRGDEPEDPFEIGPVPLNVGDEPDDPSKSVQHHFAERGSQQGIAKPENVSNKAKD